MVTEMKELFKKLKVKLNQKNIIILTAIIAVVAVAIGFFVFMTSDYHNAYSDAEGSTENLFYSSASDGKGLSFTGNDIITVQSFSSRMFVLTEKLLAAVDTDGEIKYSKVHNYLNPAIRVSDKYGIIFNRNSHEYMIFTKRGIIYEGKSVDENDIIAADINNKGDIVLSTKSDTSASRVYLISKDGDCRYIWACGEEYAITLDLDENSKKIAAGALGAKDGEIMSKTYLLDIYSEKAQCEFTYEGDGITDIKFLGKDIVSVFSKERVLYDIKAAKGAPEKAEYISEAVSVFTDESGNSAVISDCISGFDRTSLSVYDSKNRAKFTLNLDGKPEAVTMKRRTAFVCSGNTVYEVVPGKIKNTTELDFDAFGLILCGRKLFAFSSGILREVK